MLLDDFRRVTKACPCPICEHHDWCLVSRDDPPSRVICSRTDSKQRWGDAGWLHVLRDDGRPRPRTRSIVIPIRAAASDFGGLAAEYRDRARPDAVARIAAHLGVSPISLERLGIGWDGRNWTFPMSEAGGTVLGIRLRTQSGRKFAVKGGKQGLFIPTDLTGVGPLLVTEGPTDTAAALDLGFDAIGRPSCRGGTRLITELVMRRKTDRVVIVADADVAGRGGRRRPCFGARVLLPRGPCHRAAGEGPARVAPCRRNAGGGP